MNFNLPIQEFKPHLQTVILQNTLAPQDLLPEGQASEIQQFNEGVPDVGQYFTWCKLFGCFSRRCQHCWSKFRMLTWDYALYHRTLELK